VPFIRYGSVQMVALNSCITGKALQICLENDINKAYLQSKSPTCGCGEIYDGNFTNTLKPGNGIFTALLKNHCIEVVAV